MTSALSPAEVLRAAADLIEPPNAWTQGWFARDCLGNEVKAGSPNATCWCLFGAVMAVQGASIYDTDLDVLVERFVTPVTGSDVGDWNDAKGRKQSEVVFALRAAADLAEVGG